MRRLWHHRRRQDARTTLISCQKDEGPHLIEWLAYHKAIGFERIIIAANDCTDGSDEMLVRLDQLGELQYLPLTDIPPGQGAQNHLVDILSASDLFDEGEWLCWLDLDEFLNIHLGRGHLDDLKQAMARADGLRINWRIFGATKTPAWPGRQLHPDLCKCSDKNFVIGPQYLDNQTFKSFYRYRSGMCIDIHGPAFRAADIAAKPVWWHGSGGRIRKRPGSWKTQKLRVGPSVSCLNIMPTYDWAQINHYATRHLDLVALRRKRGLGSSYVPPDPNTPGREDFAQRYSDDYYARYNKTEAEDRTILRYLPAVNAEMARLLADDALRQLHDNARATLAQFLADQT